MSNIKNRRSFGVLTFIFTIIFGASVPFPLAADTIVIQFEDLDIEYDGTDIFDAESGSFEPDPVANTAIYLGGIPLVTIPSGVTADLLIPGVSDVEAGVGVSPVISDPDGFFKLDFGDDEFLDLVLDSVDVIFSDNGIISFVFGGVIGAVSGQLLPEDLFLGETVSLSFQTTVVLGTLTKIEDEGGEFLTGFSALGTGSIQGSLEVDPMSLPEPATIVLALFGLVAMSLVSFSTKESR